MCPALASSARRASQNARFPCVPHKTCDPELQYPLNAVFPGLQIALALTGAVKDEQRL